MSGKNGRAWNLDTLPFADLQHGVLSVVVGRHPGDVVAGQGGEPQSSEEVREGAGLVQTSEDVFESTDDSHHVLVLGRNQIRAQSLVEERAVGGSVQVEGHVGINFGKVFNVFGKFAEGVGLQEGFYKDVRIFG